MRNKRLLVVLLGLVFMLAVVACGNKETSEKNDDKKAQETVQSETENDAEEGENAEEDTGKEAENSEDAIKEETPTNTEDNNTQSVVPTVEKVTMYAKSSVNVRSGAGTSNAQIGSLTKGQEVVKVGEENGWSKIEFNGGVGYVNSKYLSVEKVSTSTANNTGNKNNTGSTTPSTSQPIQTPTETKPSVTECEHWYQPEFKECTAKKQYIYGCNGCGYPLCTIQNHDAVNLPDLYSHPPYYSEKLGRECNGGAFHSEMYYQGYCATCHSEIQLRSCSVFYVMGATCIKNEVLGAYEKVETGRYPAAYMKSCDCGQNILLAGNDDNSGLLIIKETCKYCGDVKTYPEQ